MATEPCRHCGHDTAGGTSRFTGRVKLVGEATEYVCPVCLDDHPIRDPRGVVLTKERLAALSYTVFHQGSSSG